MEHKSLIEVLLPLDAISREAIKERNNPWGHPINTLHVWWARRPLVVARAAVLAALLPGRTPEDVRRYEDLVRRVCVTDPNPSDVEEAQQAILDAWNGEAPKVLDCFAGGGSIPLEALRLGCEAHALEYNPVAYLILKAMLEVAPRVGEGVGDLVRKWGRRVYDTVRPELAPFYPNDADGSTPVAYLWCRTVRCPAPGCGVEIPLLRNFWLCTKKSKETVLYPVINKAAKEVRFEPRPISKVPGAFDPDEGTVRRATARCLVDKGHTVSDDYVREQGQKGRMGHRMTCVVTMDEAGKGRYYRAVEEADLRVFRKAELALIKKAEESSGPLSLVPDEPAPPADATSCRNAHYGMTDWGKFFNPRQLLCLTTFAEKIRGVLADRDLSEADCPAVALGLAFALSKVADRNSVLTHWHNGAQKVEATFSGHRLAMAWDYPEQNPLPVVAGSWLNAFDYVAPSLDYCAVASDGSEAISYLGTASRLPLKDRSIAAVVIDPPYYDNVTYADLADFFYVWFKRSIADQFPDAFEGPLSPKHEEAIMEASRFGGNKEAAALHFETMMGGAFGEMRRVLRDDGVTVVMFTHKSTEAWEKLLGTLLDQGHYVTSSLPVHTEMAQSTHTRGLGSVTSTVLLTCRKRTSPEKAWFEDDVLPELNNYVSQRLEEFWAAGIAGADFFISAIGPGVEVFGKYAEVRDRAGKPVNVGQLLDEVRRITSDFVLRRVLGQDAMATGVDGPTRFYVLARWAYGDGILPYDDVRKMALVFGFEVDELVQGRRLAQRDPKKKDIVRLLSFEERAREDLISLAQPTRDPLVNAIHLACLAWQRGGRETVDRLLRELALSDSAEFWTVAQALSHLLPDALEERAVLERILGVQSTRIRGRAAPVGQQELL